MVEKLVTFCGQPRRRNLRLAFAWYKPTLYQHPVNTETCELIILAQYILFFNLINSVNLQTPSIWTLSVVAPLLLSVSIQMGLNYIRLCKVIP